MNMENEIVLWTDKQEDAAKSALPTLSKSLQTTTKVSAGILVENLRQFLETFQNSLDKHLNNTDSLFSVDSIELNLAVNAEGGIEMIGKLTAGVQSSVKVLLRKRQSEKE